MTDYPKSFHVCSHLVLIRTLQLFHFIDEKTETQIRNLSKVLFAL